jgi:hypothetical protein
VNAEAKRTTTFAGVAVALALLAIVTTPRTAREASVFSGQGGDFYPAFKDPLKVAALEVIEPEEFGTFKPFRVQVVDGQWSIPSHSNYPADGKDRLAKTAASVMDLKKDRLASENPKEYEELGVGDPQDPALQGKKGRGKRVRLFDAAGTILADYIFGKETKEGAEYRYVRVPDQKQTWAVKVKPDISVKFEDWVETDLLKMGGASVRKVAIDKYSYDAVEQKIKDRASYAAARDDAGAPWKITEMKEAEEPNAETLSTLTSTLSGLKLTGVRRKPDVVAQAQDLRNLGKMPRELLIAVARQLAGRGFFLYSEDRNTFGMISSEGEMQVACDDGVVYTLRFGDVLVGSGDEVSAGSPQPDEKDPKDPKKDDKKDDKKAGSTENRYLMVSAAYDDALVGPAPAEPKPYKADPSKKPEEQKAEEEKAKKDKEDYETKKKDWEKKRADGKKRAEELTKRFAPWYYVISADAFKKLRVERSALVKAKEAPKDEKKPEDKKPEPPKDEKKAEPPKDDKKPEAPKDGKKPDAPKDEKKPEDKKPDGAKPDEKKPDAPKPDDKKP